MGRIFGKSLDFIICIALVIMSIIVFMNVILRYVFSSGIAWSIELSQLLFVLVVFLGAIRAFQDHQHIVVDIIIEAVPKKIKKLFSFLSNVIVIYTMVIMFQGSLKLVQNNMVMKTPLLKIPMSYVYSLGLLLSVSVIIFALYNMIKLFKKEVSNKESNIEHQI